MTRELDIDVVYDSTGDGCDMSPEEWRAAVGSRSAAALTAAVAPSDDDGVPYFPEFPHFSQRDRIAWAQLTGAPVSPPLTAGGTAGRTDRVAPIEALKALVAAIEHVGALEQLLLERGPGILADWERVFAASDRLSEALRPEDVEVVELLHDAHGRVERLLRRSEQRPSILASALAAVKKELSHEEFAAEVARLTRRANADTNEINGGDDDA